MTVMFKLFLGLMAFACCIYIIGLICVVVGAAFELIFQYWWVLALVITLAVYIYLRLRNKKKAKTKMPRNLDELVSRDNGPTIETEQQMLDFALSHELVDSITTRIVEVSCLNDDGSSRQQVLSQCKHGDPVGLYWHSLRGVPACAIISDHGTIGYLKADIAADLHAKYVNDDIGNMYGFVAFVERITNGENGYSYGCIISISICKQREIVPESIAEPNPESNTDFSTDSVWLAYGGVESELLNVDLMDGHEFEYWCAALLRKVGFQKVEVTQGSGDDGVDILAEKDSIRYAIQCKRYNTHLGNKPIQEVHTGKAVYSCHVGAVMTNQYFTEGGQRAAKATGTLLWDRDWLHERIADTKLSNEQHPVDPLGAIEEPDGDEMLPAAVDIVLETGQASVTMLQRRLHLGYARASRVIDEMEEKGFIGPFQGSKPRAILITKQEWNAQRKSMLKVP